MCCTSSFHLFAIFRLDISENAVCAVFVSTAVACNAGVRGVGAGVEVVSLVLLLCACAACVALCGSKSL